MASLWIAVAATVSAALAIAGLGAWWFVRSQRGSMSTDTAPVTDAADMEPLIEFAAQRWAAVHGRPEAAGLVADKLRTLYGITYERPVALTRKRWFR